jgi:hypothetical protein
VVIVISDLYEDEAVSPEIRTDRDAWASDVIVVHSLAREELTLDVGGAAEFVDLESGGKLMVQPPRRVSRMSPRSRMAGARRAAVATRRHLTTCA